MAGAIATIDCPAWGSAHQAEVKTDRNGRPYVYCPECGAQFITRNEHQAKGLRTRFADRTVPSANDIEEPTVAVPTEAVPTAAEENKQPPVADKKRSVWAPLIGG